jgi:O-antigen ligase
LSAGPSRPTIESSRSQGEKARPDSDSEPARKRSTRRPASAVANYVLLVPIGLLLGLSPFVGGLYDIRGWAVAGIAVPALLVAAVISGPPRMRPRVFVAVGALFALWLWSWLSTLWAESTDQALVGTSRWFLYAALLAAFVILVRDHRIGLALVGAAAIGILVSAIYVVVMMLGHDGQSLFLGGRLNEPLGYINAQAAYFLLAFWPFLAVAEAVRRSWVGGISVACCVLMAGLALMSQTRAVVPGVVITAGVMVAFVPGRLRRLAVLACIAVGLGLALGPLLEVYRGAHGAPSAQDLKDAARALVLGALAAGALWTVADLLASQAGARSAKVRRLLPRAGLALVLGLTVVALLAAAINANRIGDRVDRTYDQFVHLKTSSGGGNRFTSGGGSRYDYWRIAWGQFSDHPFAGEGAGNFDRTYFLKRKTTEDVRQPHSIELQTLSELGLVGGALLIAFVVAVLLGFGRAARAARRSREWLAVAVAGGGAFVAWLTHTSVDWLHLVPGLTGVALAAAALLLAPSERRPRLKLKPAWYGLMVAGVLAVAIVGGLSVAHLAGAERARHQAIPLLNSDPRAALRDANRALELNDQSVPALIVQSAAYARLGDYRAARASLHTATRLEPHDFVPWGLLGDLAVRRRDFAAAKRAYKHALSLNPRDPFVQTLAKDPRVGLSLARSQ